MLYAYRLPCTLSALYKHLALLVLCAGVDASTPQQVTIAPLDTLTIATTNAWYFHAGGHTHGLGHDLLGQFARDTGRQVYFVEYSDSQGALKALKAHRVDIALAKQIGAPDLGCGALDFAKHHLPKVQLVAGTLSMQQELSHYFCTPKMRQIAHALANFYDETLWQNDYTQNRFLQALHERLPQYQSSFAKHAKTFDHDWQLLAVIAYQESHWRADAVSPTGVRGLMMLTQDTANAMGVDDREDPVQSIEGGARYLRALHAQFADVPEYDRLWFVLSAYNMGPQAVRRIQETVAQAGGDGARWADIYAYLSASDNPKHAECVRYVGNIRLYLERIKVHLPDDEY